MRCKALHRRNGTPAKVLSRLLWHPAYQAGFPVRFRVASNIVHPVVRFNGYWLDVRLPIEQGRYIRLLTRLVKQWCNGQPQSENPTPKAPTNGTPTNRTRPVVATKPMPTNENKPKPQHKSGAIPTWRREWEQMWDRVAQALFGTKN